MTNKVKLFVFSNTYTARVFLRCLEHIINNPDFEIVLLSELGVSNDLNLTINEYETLQQCVEACTQVLIVCNDTIPKSKIDLVSSLANLHNKKCTTVRDFRNEQNIYTKAIHSNQNINDKPLILIVSYGTHTQLSCWETIIYKLLLDSKFKVFPKSSDEYNNVIEWTSLCDLPNDSFNDRFVTEPECEVEVQCLQYYPNINNEVDNILYQLNPDVIIVSVCNNYYNYDEIRNIFKFKHDCVIDVFAKSELIEIVNKTEKRKLIFDFSPFRNREDSTVSLNDPLLIEHLSKIILPKIALPDGVTII